MNRPGFQSVAITGYWYPTDSSARFSAELEVSNSHFSLQIENNPAVQGEVGHLSISDRIGSIPRKITLPDKSVFETPCNDEVDVLLKEAGHKDGARHFIHIMETHWGWIAIAFIVTLLASFSGIKWGLPWTSEKLAYALPHAVIEQISEGTLDLIDEYLFAPSELSEETQQRIRSHFNDKLLSVQSEEFQYRLQFRKMAESPNAFALPSGEIVITDAMVELADNQEEIDAVLLHEIGHVVHRHGLQQVIHSSIVTIGITLLFGDASGIEEIIVALPSFLLESQYSRRHESEADAYAFEKMVELGIDPVHFANIFVKMDALAAENDTDEISIDDGQDNPPGSDVSILGKEISEYLSSHPVSSRRIERAREYSEKCFAVSNNNCKPIMHK